MEKTLLDTYERTIGESGLLQERVHYYHFDFHVECEENSTPMMDYIRQLFPTHMNKMGIFIQNNQIVREKSASGLMETRSLVSTVEQM